MDVFFLIFFFPFVYSQMLGSSYFMNYASVLHFCVCSCSMYKLQKKTSVYFVDTDDEIRPAGE